MQDMQPAADRTTATVKSNRKPPQMAAQSNPKSLLDPDLKHFADTVVIPALLSIHARHTSEKREQLESSEEVA
jgi:hypothetical protein